MEELYQEAFKYPDSVLYYGACNCLLNMTKAYLKTKKGIIDSPNKVIIKPYMEIKYPYTDTYQILSKFR